MSRPSDAETYQRAKAALQASLAKTRGQLALDADDRVRRLEDNLVCSVTPPLFEMDFQADGGEEMQVRCERHTLPLRSP
jgi:hypothetical protein